MKNKIDKIYIIHAPDLKDRRASLDVQLSKLNFDIKNVEWRYTYHRSSVPADIKNKYYKSDRKTHDIKKAYVPGYRADLYGFLHLTDGYIAVALEHIFALEKIVQDRTSMAMVIEDDVIFCEDFSNKLVHYMNQLPLDWDIFYPGAACNQHLPQTDPNKNVYLHPKKLTRTACCYILKLETVKKILKTIIPFTMPIDFELIYQHHINNLNVYWGEPGLTGQGSETGVYKSLFR